MFVFVRGLITSVSKSIVNLLSLRRGELWSRDKVEQRFSGRLNDKTD